MSLDTFVARPLVLALTCILAKKMREERGSMWSEIGCNLSIGFISESGQTLVNAWLIFSASFTIEQGNWFVVCLRFIILVCIGVFLKRYAYKIPPVEEPALRKQSTETTESETFLGPLVPSKCPSKESGPSMRGVSSDQPSHWSYPVMKQTSTEFEISAQSSVLHTVAAPSSAEQSNLQEKARDSVDSDLELAPMNSQKSAMIWH